MNTFVQASYIIAAALFILAIKWMGAPSTSRRGVVAGEIGMLLAVVGTLVSHQVVSYELILIAFFVGSAAGVPLAYLMPMTAVPQRTALSHAFGALAAALIGTAEFYKGEDLHGFKIVALTIEVLLGYLTFTGSLMAFGKLQELLPQRPITFKFQNSFNFAILGAAVLLGIYTIVNPAQTWAFLIFSGLALVFGILLIVPIGGADMPTVIALLNSYAGLSASFMGFVLNNYLLVIAGALDGASGFILSVVMCKAMNRSFANVLFGAFGQLQVKAGELEQRSVRSATPEEAASILDSARSVIIVPGYGMAVAQAQHKVRELFDALTRRGVDVKFAIHPVAGRMPGHMNVLLAEADIPYDRLFEMDDINSEFAQADVALVVGANDVTNPAARSDTNSPIYGMPILNVDHARAVMVIKRSRNPGFAGIDNELYYMQRTLMLFGDAKSFLAETVKEVQALVSA